MMEKKAKSMFLQDDNNSEEDKLEIFWGNTVHDKVLCTVPKFIKKATRRRKRFLREKAPIFKTVRWRLKL